MSDTSATALSAAPQAIILYSRATFFKRQRMKELKTHLAAAWPGVALRDAYEDQLSPALPDVLDELYAQGIRKVTVLPCGLPIDLAISTWLPGALRAHLDGLEGLEVSISRPLEDYVDYAAASDHALAAEPASDVSKARASMGKPGWTDVPEHRHQVFFCMGARCVHRGAHHLLNVLRSELRDNRALNVGEGSVRLARSSCLYPCNQGPLLAVHPDGIWYGGLTEECIQRIVRDHLATGQVVDEAVIHRACPTEKAV